MAEASQEDPEHHGRRARSFGALAEEYERFRPGYPDGAVDWLLPPGARRVADLGAGTGKLTGSLLARGVDVVAIEPDPAMLAVLRRVHPAAEARVAGADALPLDDGSVDAVLVAQAWHWFPHERAAAEVRRVLRPCGWLGLVWNMPTPEEAWQLQVDQLNGAARGRPHHSPRDSSDAVEVEGLPSADLESADFPWVEPLTPEQLVTRMATYSHVALLPGPRRNELLGQVRAVAEQEAARRGTSAVLWKHTARCVRWRPVR